MNSPTKKIIAYGIVSISHSIIFLFKKEKSHSFQLLVDQRDITKTHQSSWLEVYYFQKRKRLSMLGKTSQNSLGFYNRIANKTKEELNSLLTKQQLTPKLLLEEELYLKPKALDLRQPKVALKENKIKTGMEKLRQPKVALNLKPKALDRIEPTFCNLSEKLKALLREKTTKPFPIIINNWNQNLRLSFSLYSKKLLSKVNLKPKALDLRQPKVALKGFRFKATRSNQTLPEVGSIPPTIPRSGLEPNLWLGLQDVILPLVRSGWVWEVSIKGSLKTIHSYNYLFNFVGRKKPYCKLMEPGLDFASYASSYGPSHILKKGKILWKTNHPSGKSLRHARGALNLKPLALDRSSLAWYRIIWAWLKKRNSNLSLSQIANRYWLFFSLFYRGKFFSFPLRSNNDNWSENSIIGKFLINKPKSLHSKSKNVVCSNKSYLFINNQESFSTVSPSVRLKKKAFTKDSFLYHTYFIPLLHRKMLPLNTSRQNLSRSSQIVSSLNFRRCLIPVIKTKTLELENMHSDLSVLENRSFNVEKRKIALLGITNFLYTKKEGKFLLKKSIFVFFPIKANRNRSNIKENFNELISFGKKSRLLEIMKNTDLCSDFNDFFF